MWTYVWRFCILNNDLVHKTGDTINGSLTITNGSNSVVLFADNEGGTVDRTQVANNRGVHDDVISGVSRKYLYQINPWKYLNDIRITDNAIITVTDFMNGNGITLNALNAKFKNYEPKGNFVGNKSEHGISLSWDDKGLCAYVDGTFVGYLQRN